MLKNIKGTVMEGAKDGLSLYAAAKLFQVGDSFASSMAPSLPVFVRKPAVGIGLAMLLSKVVGGRIGKLATAVAFEQTIASFADPMVNPVLLSIAGGAAPTTQGYRVTQGYAPAMRGGFNGRSNSMRGYTGVEA